MLFIFLIVLNEILPEAIATRKVFEKKKVFL